MSNNYRPTDERISELYNEAVVKGGKSPKEFFDALFAKGWRSPEDFPDITFEYDDSGNFKELSEDEPVTNEDTINGVEEDETNEVNETDKQYSSNYDKAKDFIKTYNQLVKNKQKLLNGNGSKEEIENINNQLKQMEDGDEFKEILQSIKEEGLGDKWYQIQDIVGEGIYNIINKRGSSIDKNYERAFSFFSPSSMYPTQYKYDINSMINDYLGNSKQGQSSNKENSNKSLGLKISSLEDRFKDTKIADNMSFGGDVKSSEYLNRRNDTLSKHLKANGIETPEEIEEYLNKYPSWKDAPQERKDNTVSILADKVSKMKTTNNKQDDKGNDELNTKKATEEVDEDNKRKGKAFAEKPGKTEERKGKTFSSLSEKIKFDTDNDSPLNDEDTIYTYQGPVKQGEIKGKDYIEDREEQTPENNKYLWLDEYIRNFDTDASRKKELESMGYKVNKNGFYEKDGVKTRVYKDGRYNPSTEEIAKGGIGTATKNINKNSQDEIDILLQEQGYNGPKDKEGHFIPMNEDTLNGAGDKEETKSKTKLNLKKGKSNGTKNNNSTKSSPTILGLLKGKKK